VGISAVILASAVAFSVLKWAGAIYLVWLGFRLLLSAAPSASPSPAAPAATPTPASLRHIFLQGALTNVLNPKVAIFFLAFLPQFVDPAVGLGPIPFLFLGALFVSGGTLWCLGLAIAAARATRAIRQNPGLMTWLDRLSGCVYIGLGLNLLRSRPQPA